MSNFAYFVVYTPANNIEYASSFVCDTIQCLGGSWVRMHSCAVIPVIPVFFVVHNFIQSYTTAFDCICIFINASIVLFGTYTYMCLFSIWDPSTEVIVVALNQCQSIRTLQPDILVTSVYITFLTFASCMGYIILMIGFSPKILENILYFA